jgi:septum formation topological specificity factor MinE
VDEEKFTASLLGKSKQDFIEILSQYENIDSADLKVNPPWSSSIPKEAEDVEVRINYP